MRYLGSQNVAIHRSYLSLKLVYTSYATNAFFDHMTHRGDAILESDCGKNDCGIMYQLGRADQEGATTERESSSISYLLFSSTHSMTFHFKDQLRETHVLSVKKQLKLTQVLAASFTIPY